MSNHTVSPTLIMRDGDDNSNHCTGNCQWILLVSLFGGLFLIAICIWCLLDPDSLCCRFCSYFQRKKEERREANKSPEEKAREAKEENDKKLKEIEGYRKYLHVKEHCIPKGYPIPGNIRVEKG